MTIQQAETIAAIATAPGKASVGIVRVSGKHAVTIAQKITKQNLKPRYATFCHFYNSDDVCIDQGIAINFPNPNSFTGEDVVEFQGHGGPIVLDMLLQTILNFGARMARAGEFSERAFLNGKIDLAQAEAIADLIDSGSQQAALAANNSLQGDFSDSINTLQMQLTELRIFVEAALDFPEEEIDFLSDQRIQNQLSDIKAAFNDLFQQTQQGKILRDGINIVIIGKPNVGKSSLLNQFTGQETAIVTSIAGTTRDILKEYIQIDGIPIHIIDTAGIRETAEVVEEEGIRRAFNEVEKADLILCVFDALEFEQLNLEPILQEWNLHKKQLLLIVNKIDLISESTINLTDKFVGISAKTGRGINELKRLIKSKIGFSDVSGTDKTIFSARRRHVDALEKAYQFLLNGIEQLNHSHAGELLAEDLSQAQKQLSEITGEFTADDLLGKIFSSFCIGK